MIVVFLFCQLASISAFVLCSINDLFPNSMQCNMGNELQVLSAWLLVHFQEIPSIGSQEYIQESLFGAVIRRFHWYKYKPTRVPTLILFESLEPFRSQCHCPWICLFGHFYSRSRGKEQIAALLASVCHPESCVSFDRPASSQWPTMSSVVLEDLQYCPKSH